MASTITRDTWTNDSGTAASPNLDGTVINNAALQNNIYARVDEMFAGAGSYATLDLGAALRVSTILYVNDTANTQMTTGITINQGGADNEALACKSSDVSHGMTSLAEADTYGTLKKSNSTGGGIKLSGYATDAGGNIGAVFLDGFNGSAADTTKSTAGLAVVIVNTAVRSGTSQTAVAADGNMLVIRNNGTTRFIFDSDGDSHQDVGTAWTNFDDGDDIARLDAVAVTLAREGDPLREEFSRSFEERRDVLEAMPGKPLVTFNDDGHHFVNMSRLTMLLTGAVRQLARRQQGLEVQLAGLLHE